MWVPSLVPASIDGPGRATTHKGRPCAHRTVWYYVQPLFQDDPEGLQLGIGGGSVGRFIALEGIEGSGKTLQLSLLSDEFKRRNIPIVVTREPGGTPFGSRLRRILLESGGPGREAEAELLLYLADRFQHLAEVIEPALRQGRTVLCDRYHAATLAYQGYARGIGFPLVDKLARALRIRMPDLTLILDLEVESGLARARRRNAVEGNQAWGRFEAETMRFHRRVREGYRQLAEREPDRITLVDASGNPQQTLKKLLAELEGKALIG